MKKLCCHNASCGIFIQEPAGHVRRKKTKLHQMLCVCCQAIVKLAALTFYCRNKKQEGRNSVYMKVWVQWGFFF